MKKTFTFLWALCAFIVFGFSSAKAGEITYDFRAYAQQYCASAMEELKLTGEAFKVGSIQVTTIDNLDHLSLDGRFAVQSSDLKMRLRTSTDGGMWNVTGTGARMVVIKNLKAGDKVTFDTNGSTFVSGNVDGLANGDAIVNNTTYEITADGFFAINVNRSSCLNIVKIETAAEETVSSPTIAVTGANGIERTVVITPGHSDYEGENDCITQYTLDGSDPIESSTAEVSTGDDPIEFTIDETCTVKAVTVGKTGVFSEVASLEVSAGDYLPLNLALSVSMNDGVATFTATSNNSNIYGAPTADITFELDGQAVGDGNSFTPTKDGTMLVTASADGYGDTEISVPVFAKYEVRWQSSDYSTPGIAGDFEGWIMSSETGRWANWAEGEYIYYVLEEATAQNITLEGDEEGKVGVRMRGVLSFVDGFGISRNISGTETIGNIASKGLGRIAIFRIYNGYNKSDSSYEVGYVNVDGANWLQHQLQGGHCLVQTIAYMGVEQQTGAATAIENVNAETEDTNVYNLQGQRVSKTTHGLYIQNGKKILVK